MRMLVKLAAAKDQLPAQARFGTAGPEVTLTPLFEVRAPASAAMPAAGATEQGTWCIADLAGHGGFGANSAHPWDLAHDLRQRGLGLDGPRLLAVEPDMEQGWTWAPEGPGQAPALPLAAAREGDAPEPEMGPPYDKGGVFAWHLDDAHSGLRAARAAVGEAAQRAITIVHLDTGYDPDHLTLPVNLDLARARNFVEGSTDATDKTPADGILRNRGHGTGTLGILSGKYDPGLVGVPPECGPIGGAPYATVVPVRVANSVVHFGTSAVARGIDYARQISADVVSMSMGGLPSQAWADAVNAAYEAGVVLVCAAGNSFAGFPTSLIVYPARFNRVIAACGVMAKGHPYYGFRDPGKMEGCAGPMGKMKTALSAFTPNTPWARLGRPGIVDMDGAGTSSATPQVAAAAALWLAKNGKNLPRSFQRVEAVRAALFGAALREGANDDRPDANGVDPLLGRGILRARDALDYPPAANLPHLPPDSASFAFLHLLTSGLGADGDPQRQRMLALEMTQLALSSREAREVIPDPDVAPEEVTPAQRRRFMEALLAGNTLSRNLRAYLEGQLGLPSSVGLPPPGGSQPVPADPAAADAGAPQRTQRLGSQLVWRKVDPAPTRRRLRVFATDPADTARMQTERISRATIEVPWEGLRPGPVGEYLEVVDVDPASDAAYEPVDLDHPHMLAQDGLAPSEGNPKFHQQMVYAVAMRTIRNFEIALGRRALWAERVPQREPGGTYPPVPDGGFVRRLRIYPHALREQNAYYSPNHKALLFGYYRDAAVKGRRTVFTCLSHDIVAHETTHALLDGLHRRYQEATNPDVPAFHEAFADIVAIFQHFTMPELLKFEIARTRGDFWLPSILSDLARQFGRSLHNERALRRAIDPRARPKDGDTEPEVPLLNYDTLGEPHDRGAILLAGVFEAFVAIFTQRTRGLLRIATGGKGELSVGALHPDLVDQLACTAADTAQRMLTVCIRALDYMPPVDPTFGDYLRAVVTADADANPDHGEGLRVALAEAFVRRGIYPPYITNVSPDSLVWGAPDGPVQSARLNEFIRSLELGAYTQSDRRVAFDMAKRNAAKLHEWMVANLDKAMAESIGLDFETKVNGRPHFEVHSVRPAQRFTADGEPRTDVVAVITQQRDVDGQRVRGGCTLILDREYRTDPIRYAIVRSLRGRMDEQALGSRAAHSLYGRDPAADVREPFAVVHRHVHPSSSSTNKGPRG